MHWILQDNLYNEDGYTRLVDALNRLGITYDVTKVVPFSHELIPDVNPTGLVMACGSTTLSQIALDKGWTPGSFLNDNHDFQVWQRHYGANLLNAEAVVCRFADVEPIWDEFFIRPTGDSKKFSGLVTSWESFGEWRMRVLDLKETYTTLDGESMVCYGPLKEIWAEYRFFVIDGKIVTYSQYKQGDRVVSNEIVDDAAIDFAKKMVKLWQPARGFVLDTCITPDGDRIVEINCLNSAGFYAADVRKIVEAVEYMEF